LVLRTLWNTCAGQAGAEDDENEIDVDCGRTCSNSDSDLEYDEDKDKEDEWYCKGDGKGDGQGDNDGTDYQAEAEGQDQSTFDDNGMDFLVFLSLEQISASRLFARLAKSGASQPHLLEAFQKLILAIFISNSANAISD